MASSTVSVTEGEASFSVRIAETNSKIPCKTWYKIFGSLNSDHRPLIVLHGGPGFPHHYLLNLADLTLKHDIPVVLYDQLGTGNSTRLPDKDNKDFWTINLFLSQLERLVRHLGLEGGYDLMGHSWGGMLAATYASRQPVGLQRLIIWSSPAAARLWVEAQTTLRATLPQDLQDALIAGEDKGSDLNDQKAYENALQVYTSRFGIRMQPFPAAFLEAVAIAEKDLTARRVLLGLHTFKIVGTMRTWSMIEDAENIRVPTLLLNGKYDQAQNSTMEPYSKRIPEVKWVQLAESSHMAHFEEHERFVAVVADFLQI
ncbi:AB hydrolase-1 domain-containing protein [Mycena chlorophos]|uniref:AB hydrolase-1 domain-containing protein n=1 Tax=Mycena chlorophos TaxID=658473 RepID=A0A8H6TKB9_MYCCL|nr:AB hydrolase-1 domain-containing protein [Mycena chlorophos]